MAGKFWSYKIQPMSFFQGLKCATVLRDFPVQKWARKGCPNFKYIYTTKLFLVNIYSYNKNIFPHLKNGHQKRAHPVCRTTTKVCPNLMNVFICVICVIYTYIYITSLRAPQAYSLLCGGIPIPEHMQGGNLDLFLRLCLLRYPPDFTNHPYV